MIDPKAAHHERAQQNARDFARAQDALLQELDDLAASDDGCSPYTGNRETCERAIAEIKRLRANSEKDKLGAGQ